MTGESKSPGTNETDGDTSVLDVTILRNTVQKWTDFLKTREMILRRFQVLEQVILVCCVSV